jgi:PAS domain S-box-containing protein
MTSDFCAIVSLRAYLRVKPSRRRTITFHAVSWEEHWMLRHHSAKTAIQRAQKELHHSEEQFRLLVDGVKDYAIFMLDKAGNVVSWNTGAEQIKGYRADEILGHHFSCFYTPEDIESEKPERELESAAKDGRYEEEGWRLRKDGSRFWASVVITALRDDSGNLRGFAKVSRDITKRIEAEAAEKKT